MGGTPSIPIVSDVFEAFVVKPNIRQASSNENRAEDSISSRNLSDLFGATGASYNGHMGAIQSTPNIREYALVKSKIRQATPNKQYAVYSSITIGHSKTTIKSQVELITMNSNGPDDKSKWPNAPARRRQAIQHVILERQPDLILFQEFGWAGFHGKIWADTPIPDNYRYTGHFEASMGVDTNKVEFEDLQSDVMSILSELQRTPNNSTGKTFPMDFAPKSRMCIAKVNVKCDAFEFICISWHGIYKTKVENKKEELYNLLELSRKLKNKYKLPLIIGGDFNMNIGLAEHVVQSPFQICPYTPSARREGKVIDFFIISEELKVKGDVAFIDLDNDIGLENINSVLDHDPVVATFMIQM